MSTTPPPNDPTPPDEGGASAPTEETARMTAGDPLGGSGPPPPPPPGPQPKRLTRSLDDRVLGGVCGGVARYFGIDPVIARIVAVVLVFFGGAGVLLYLAALLLVPNEPTAGVPAAPDRNRWLAVIGVVALLVVVGPFVLVPVLVVGGLLFPLAFVVLAALVVAWLATGRWPEREARPIARATAIGLAVLVVVSVLAVASFWGAAVGGDEVVAGLVIAAGLAIVAGAFVKPVRWLIPLALALALPAGFVGAAGIDLDGGIGEERYAPGSVAEIRDHYDIGVGELVIDLRGADLPAGRDHHLNVDVGIGHALVLVDEDVCVASRAEVGAGQVDVFEIGNGGVDVDVEDMRQARSGSPRVVVDGELGVGHLEVAREEYEEYDEDDGFRESGPPPVGRRFRGRNDRCVGA